MNQAAAFIPKTPDIPPPFDHQRESVEFYTSAPHVFNMSDPGSGKTRAWLDWFAAHRDSGGGAGLVLCPKSIMTAAWENDARKYTPHLRVSVATAERRRDALKPGADLYVLNHDAVRALIKEPKLLPAGVDAFNIDESTAFKRATSQRSKAAFKLLKPFERRVIMSGTPAPQGVLDLWHQALIVDLGERLGTSYFKFRQTVCDPIQVGPHQNHVKWEEKPGALDAVIDLISDITLRYKLEDCIDMPDRVEYFVDFPLSPKHRQQYTELKDQALLMFKTGNYIDAIHAASMRIKLLQLLSGAVYDSQRVAQSINTDRYNLVIDLVEQREASLVAFMFTHQRDALIDEAKKRGLRYGLIDGSVPGNERSAVVDRFQAGHLDVIFAHPASAGHGLTLTRASAVIWASPTDNAEHWTQFNARIYRAGQTKRTEIIKVIARDTIEEKAFDNLTRKLTNQEALLEMLT